MTVEALRLFLCSFFFLIFWGEKLLYNLRVAHMRSAAGCAGI